jgi:hypothetical protein
MFIPLMMFFLMLIGVGGLGSLVAIADSTRKNLLLFTLPMFFSGLGVYLIGLGLSYLLEETFGTSNVLSILYFIFFLIGCIGGAILGFILAIRRNKKLYLNDMQD